MAEQATSDSDRVTWYGHNCWLLETAGLRVLIDPFLNDNPKSPVKADDAQADFIVVSHGHFDHISDAASIAKRTGAKVLAGFEVANWLQGQGVDEEKLVGMNPGGASRQAFGSLKMTVAHHSSSLPDGSYGGVACGLLFDLAASRIYFACDTALFSDMQLIGAAGLNLAVLPIGDLFTMGPADSIEAIKYLTPEQVAPCHYDTWPPIEQDAAAWSREVQQQTQARPVVIEPGETITVG